MKRCPECLGKGEIFAQGAAAHLCPAPAHQILGRLALGDVCRGIAETGSIPMVPISTPMAAAISPRISDFVPRPAMMVIAIQISANTSGGPMYRATTARGAATRISTSVAKASPVTDA